MGMGIRVWLALQWITNFDSDEAIIGLMARHILGGRIPTYYYGQHYLGSLDAILAAVFVRWLGSNPVALRIPSLLLFGLFMVLQTIWMRRVASWRVVVITLLVLALPHWRVLHYTYKPNVAFGLVSVIGTLTLLLVSLKPVSKLWSLLRWVGVGFLVGLGVWISPLTLVYFAAWVTTSLLQSEEWKRLYFLLKASCRQARLFGVTPIFPMAVVGVAGLVIVAFFAKGCQPRELFANARLIALAILVSLAVIAIIIGLSVSERRIELTTQWSVFIAGAIVGNTPQWKAWLFWKVPLSTAIVPSCPTEVPARIGLVVGQMLPNLWGFASPWELARFSHLDMILWGFALLLGLTATCNFLWSQRRAFWSLLSLSPLSGSSSSLVQIQIFLLFTISVALVLLGGNVVDAWNIRYLLVAWQSFAVMLALWLDWTWNRSKFLMILVLGLWGWQVAFSNWPYMTQSWYTKVRPYSPESVSCLEKYLDQQGVPRGYADYWVAYGLDFLTDERLIFTPFNGIDRYPAYTGAVSQARFQAFIFWHTSVPPPPVREKLERAVVTLQQQVCNWDVWVVDSMAHK